MAKEKEAIKETTTRVPLLDILVDHNWNARSGGWQAEKTPEGGGDELGPEGSRGFPGLIASIKEHGQDHACDVRPNPTKSRHTYMLVTGFRRTEAIRRIAEEGVNAPGIDPKNPAIKVNVRNLDESEARALNGRENIERNSLSPADTAWLVVELAKAGKDATGKELTDTAIAAKIGKSQGYVSKLHRIMNNTKASILKSWREGAADPLTVDERVKLSEIDKDKQEDTFKKLIAEETKEGTKTTGGWMKKATAQAASIGTLLGHLEREGLIDMTKLNFGKHMKELLAGGILVVKGKEGATDNQWEKLGKAADEAYKAAYEKTAPAEGEEAAE